MARKGTAARRGARAEGPRVVPEGRRLRHRHAHVLRAVRAIRRGRGARDAVARVPTVSRAVPILDVPRVREPPRPATGRGVSQRSVSGRDAVRGPSRAARLASAPRRSGATPTPPATHGSSARASRATLPQKLGEGEEGIGSLSETHERGSIPSPRRSGAPAWPEATHYGHHASWRQTHLQDTENVLPPIWGKDSRGATDRGSARSAGAHLRTSRETLPP